MAETTGGSRKRQSAPKSGRSSTKRQQRPLTDEEKAERTSRLPQQGPDPAIFEANYRGLAEIAARMGVAEPTEGVLEVDLRNIARWLRSWPYDEPRHEVDLDTNELFDATVPTVSKALATLFLAPGAQPTHQVARLVADRYEHRIIVKRPKGQQWHEVRWGSDPLGSLEDAVALVKPAGGLVQAHELPDGRWRVHFLPRVSAQNDLANLHHTRNAEHWTPALACCTVLLPR
jgi:hypothetical protein